jgi:hypothetical protein
MARMPKLYAALRSANVPDDMAREAAVEPARETRWRRTLRHQGRLH